MLLQSFHKILLYFVIGALSFGLGCSKGLDATEKLAKPSAEEAETYGKKLEGALNACDLNIMGQLLDLGAMASEGIRTSKIPKKQQASALQTLITTMNGEILAQLCSKGEEGGLARFLRVRERQGTTTALVRLTSSEGINYIEVSIGKRKDDVVVGNDIYMFLTGSSMVETLRTIFNALIQTGEATTSKFQRVSELLTSNPAAGVQSAQSLPAKIRDTKIVQIAIVQAASNLDEKIYTDSIANYQRLFPNDPSVDLVSIDGLFLNKKYDQAIAAIDRLEKGVGGDPYLNQMRAGILIEQGTDTKRAVALAKLAVAAEPGDEDCQVILLSAEVADENFPAVVEQMLILSEKFEYQFTEAMLPELTDAHEELAKSEAWAKYTAKYPSAAAVPESE
ncbi:MAG: hypothetical protein JKY56_16290 [Kofleriaceae bacterium]|nr:hypothetical protein [Kofleriaceae bacterium]